MKGRLEVVRVLVEQDGIDLDKAGHTDDDHEDYGFQSPLQIARRAGYDAIVEVLLAAGAKDDDAAVDDDDDSGRKKTTDGKAPNDDE